MRILLSSPRSQFSTLRQIITSKAAEQKAYAALNSTEFEIYLKKFIQDKQAGKHRINRYNNIYKRICLTANRPVETILRDFMENSKKYNEENLVQTAVYLGKAFQIGLADNGGDFDRTGTKLYLSPYFDHFIEQVKYALGDNSYIQYKNITKILNALSQMNYLDMQIISLTLQKIQKILNISPQQCIPFQQRLYQSEKKGYYKRNLIGLNEDLLQSEKFQKNLEYFEERKRELAEKATFDGVDIAVFEGEHNYQLVIELISQFEKFNKGLKSFVDAVIAIRQQYQKLVTISQNHSVLRNPELNHAALLVQQKLIQMHLIDINDVQNPNQILNQKAQNKKIEQIVKIFMSQTGNDNFEDYLVDENKNLDYLKVKKLRQLVDISALIQALVKYSKMPYKLHNSVNNLTFITLKWQNHYQPAPTTPYQSDPFIQTNVYSQSLYRLAYAQVQTFIARHISIIELTLIEGGLKEKIRWYEALFEAGLYSDVITQVKGIKLSTELLDTLDDAEFISFVGILSLIWQTNYRLNEKMESYVCNRIDNFVDQYTSFKNDTKLGIKQLCNLTNYLYQQTKGNTASSKSYQSLITLLSQQVRYHSQNSSIHPSLSRQAKRILFFQQAEAQSQQYAGSLANLAQLENLSNPKGNPFINTLYGTFGRGQKMASPYVVTGVNEDNQVAGIYFVDSDSSGLDGAYVSGNTVAYCQRLYHKFNVKVTPISINKFLDITYTQKNSVIIGQSSSIKLKSASQILQIISKQIPRNNQILVDFVKVISKNLTEFMKTASSNQNGINFKVRKIISDLKKITALSNQEKDILFITQFYAKRCYLLVQLELLKRDFNMLSTQQKQKIDQIMSRSQKGKNFLTLIQQLYKQLSKALQKIKSKPAQTQNELLSFKGKRVSINLLQQNQKQIKSLTKEQLPIEHQLLSEVYLVDSGYVQYRDWSDYVKGKFNFNEIKVSELRDITKLLVMRFCPKIKDRIVAIPLQEGRMFIPYYPLNLEKKYYYHSKDIQQKDQIQQIAQQYRKIYKGTEEQSKLDGKIIQLQNLKRELKLNNQPKEILKFLLSFNFIQDIIARNNSGVSVNQYEKKYEQKYNAQFLERDPKEYFNYLEHKADKMYLQSPYLVYIFNKIQQSQTLKQKILQRKTNKAKLRILFNNGTIDKKQYFQNMKKQDQNLVKQMKKLKKKLLTHVDGVAILDDASKIVQLNQNIQDLERVLRSAYYYDQNQDQDLISTGGNYAEALKIKRWKAERNFCLFRVFYKMAAKEEISADEQKFYDNWKNSVIQGITSYKIRNQYTKMSVNSLSSKDLQRLNLKRSNIGKKAPELAVSDLILELNNFFDQSVIQRLQAKIYADYFSKKLNVPEHIFSTSGNKLLKSLSYKVEEAIFQKQAELNQKQIDCLIQMTRIFKTQAVSDREKYDMHYKNIREDLGLINKCKYRNPLTAQYLRQKDYEYYNEYFPQDIQQKKKAQTLKIWKQIFNKQASDTSSSQIRKKVSQICKRMLLLKSNQPPYLSNLVLSILNHPKTDTLTKQTLIAYLQLFKINLKLDSADLIGLAEDGGFDVERVQADMRKWNGNGAVLQRIL